MSVNKIIGVQTYLNKRQQKRNKYESVKKKDDKFFNDILESEYREKKNSTI